MSIEESKILKIVRALEAPKTFTEIKREVGLTDMGLWKNLQSLESSKLIAQTTDKKYALTESGKAVMNKQKALVLVTAAAEDESDLETIEKALKALMLKRTYSLLADLGFIVTRTLRIGKGRVTGEAEVKYAEQAKIIRDLWRKYDVHADEEIQKVKQNIKVRWLEVPAIALGAASWGTTTMRHDMRRRYDYLINAVSVTQDSVLKTAIMNALSCFKEIVVKLDKDFFERR